LTNGASCLPLPAANQPIFIGGLIHAELCHFLFHSDVSSIYPDMAGLKSLLAGLSLPPETKGDSSPLLESPTAWTAILNPPVHFEMTFVVF
jgi:hypothetical protein